MFTFWFRLYFFMPFRYCRTFATTTNQKNTKPQRQNYLPHKTPPKYKIKTDKQTNKSPNNLIASDAPDRKAITLSVVVHAAVYDAAVEDTPRIGSSSGIASRRPVVARSGIHKRRIDSGRASTHIPDAF